MILKPLGKSDSPGAVAAGYDVEVNKWVSLEHDPHQSAVEVPLEGENIRGSWRTLVKNETAVLQLTFYVF